MLRASYFSSKRLAPADHQSGYFYPLLSLVMDTTYIPGPSILSQCHIIVKAVNQRG